MTQNMKTQLKTMGQAARKASAELAAADTAQKNAALLAIADSVEKNADELKAENQKDLESGIAKGLDSALLDRLELTDNVISGMAEGLRQIASLPDPVGQMDDMKYVPSGIQLGKMRVPIGVIGIIYESRPNVTVDAAALCLKSGNATILRGGSEAIHSNIAIAKCVQSGLASAGLSSNCVQVVETTDRAAVGELIAMPEFVDVIIPRGGKGLIQRISDDAKVPVIKHLDGNCHVYIDSQADKEKAIDIAYNAKARRYGVCNAMETLLVHADTVNIVMPELIKRYVDKGIELRGCERMLSFAEKTGFQMTAATEDDWFEEYLDAILAVKVVDSMQEAIDHIKRYSSDHTEAIVTENVTKAREFLTKVDSSSVMVNASTAFADGFEFGLGAEIGISTDKLHVRGPVGLEGLTTQKYVVFGDGHIRA